MIPAWDHSLDSANNYTVDSLGAAALRIMTLGIVV
jgi:hypothetical protein